MFLKNSQNRFGGLRLIKEIKMTVAKLIEILQEVEDKSIDVVAEVNFAASCKMVEVEDGYVCLNSTGSKKLRLECYE
jgi:hypothetical protein